MSTDSQATSQPSNQQDNANLAADLIRAKLQNLYQYEPDTKEEIREAENTARPLSKHQQYIHDLNHSGKSLAEIQTAWHTYYAELPDKEKHEVWQEFYVAHAQLSQYAEQPQPPKPAHSAAKEDDKPEKTPLVVPHTQPMSKPRTESEIKRQLVAKISQRAKGRKLSRKDHFKSLGFGLGMGFLAIFIIMFTFFNEQFITPFITPSTRVSATPIIVDPTNNTVGPAPEIIIPKINVDIPVLYDVSSIDDTSIQQGLDESVVHYPTTANPGELGNGAIFGHSSSNIFNSGKAKFAFLQLRQLEDGDTFYLNYQGKQYVYKVIAKKVVPPTDVSVLSDTLGHPATFALITCDPPGLNVNRLIISGEQISPAPAVDKQNNAKPSTDQKPVILPGNSESLWQKFTNWLSH